MFETLIYNIKTWLGRVDAITSYRIELKFMIDVIHIRRYTWLHIDIYIFIVINIAM